MPTTRLLREVPDFDALDFSKSDGLVTVIAQDADTGRVLMVAHADRHALDLTVETGDMHYTSRTRGLWRKGETSGNTQRVVSLTADCDGDSILARVITQGPACHTGAVSCFGEVRADALAILDLTIDQRGSSVSGDTPGYTRRLLDDRNLRLKKIGEEAAELVVACSDGDCERAVEEAADLVYHTLVALHAAGGTLEDVQRALARRAL